MRMMKGFVISRCGVCGESWMEELFSLDGGKEMIGKVWGECVVKGCDGESVVEGIGVGSGRLEFVVEERVILFGGGK